MKRIRFLVLYMLLFASFAGCGTKNCDSKAEEMPADYGEAVTAAQNEFNHTFSDFPNLIITETSTMARTTSTERVVIQFGYSSDNGDGVYGFEMEKTAAGSYAVIQQGENVTIDNFVREQ